MIRTRITEMLGIQYPIIGGTMMNISRPEFVAACSNAGGLGVIASAIYRDSVDGLREAIRQTRKLTDKPFAVNINLFPMLQPVDPKQFAKAVLEEGVKIVETSGHHAPEEFVAMFREAGATWMHKCAGVRYAKKAAGLGADIIEVVGFENGGAVGELDVGTLVMVPCAVDAAGKIPVIGGGGVSDGRGLLAVLSLGAEGIIMGTRILATRECPIHDNLKQVLVNASETDTVLIMRSLRASHRAWKNAATAKVLELEVSKSEPMEIFSVSAGDKVRAMYADGDTSKGILYCGQCVGLVHDIPTVKELFDRIMAEAEAEIKRLGTRVS